MISQCSKIFNVEYTPSGAAIVTADILGLNGRNSVFEPASPFTVSTTNYGNPDLDGLDFGGWSGPVTRHSSLCRPKPAQRHYSDRAGIVDVKQSRRAAVLLRENPETDFPSVNGTVPPSTEDENLAVAEEPVAEDKNVAVTDSERPIAEDKEATVAEQLAAEVQNAVVAERPVAEDKNPVVRERPVAARRAVRSSSFGSRSSTVTSAPALPVPPPKPNRQRVAMTVATLQSHVDELSAQLKHTAEERDMAVARVTELEQKLSQYCDKFGPID